MESPQTKPPQVRLRILACVLIPVLLLLADLPLYRSTWRGNAELHTVIEAIATLMALVTGAMALVRYYTKKSVAFLLLGSGYLGAGLHDGYHAIFTSSFLVGHMPSSLAALTPWSGVNSRVFLSLMMYASVLTWEGERQRLNPDRRSELVVYLVVGIWTALSFFCFAVIPLPTDYYPKLLIPRPTEIGPILFF